MTPRRDEFDTSFPGVPSLARSVLLVLVVPIAVAIVENAVAHKLTGGEGAKQTLLAALAAWLPAAFMCRGEPGRLAAVTLDANPGHSFMSIRVGDTVRCFDTTGGERPRFFDPSGASLAGLVQRHPPEW